jgi:hypothetical protein
VTGSGEHYSFVWFFDRGVLIMRVIARSLLAAFLALLGTIVLAVSWTTTTAIQLQAVTALIIGGADHPLGPRKISRGS